MKSFSERVEWPSRFILFLLGLALPSIGWAARLYEPEPLKAIRLDPGRLYDVPELKGLGAAQMAARSASDIVRFGFNTVFVYAYSSVYGAFYRTEYPLTHIEPTLGRQRFLEHFIPVAKAKGLKVIAVLPVNDFEKVWRARPAWRMKRQLNEDYVPLPASRFLSVSSQEFTEWHQGFVSDFLRRHPKVDGIEAVEPSLDLKWELFLEFPRDKAFAKLFPNETPGSKTWSAYRAEPLTRFLARFTRSLHLYFKEAHVVQTWPAHSDGRLFTPDEVSRAIGLDVSSLLSLPRLDRPDALNIELMWQQWQAQHGPAHFSPSWSLEAAKELQKWIGARARMIYHIELSTFSGPHGNRSASTDELRSLVSSLPNGLDGYDIYDYTLWKRAP